MFYNFTILLPAACVLCSVWLFFFFYFYFLDFVLSCVLLRYFLNNFKMVSFSPVVTGVTPVFTFHTLHFCNKVFIFKDHLSSLITFLSPESARAVHNTCSFFIIMDYDIWFIVRDGSVGLHLLIT